MIQIPEDLKKPIDEIKTPSNKILIICLILAIVFLGTFVVAGIKSADKQCRTENAALKIENQRLNKYIIDKAEEDNIRLKKREAYMDSVISLTKYINNQLK